MRTTSTTQRRYAELISGKSEAAADQSTQLVSKHGFLHFEKIHCRCNHFCKLPMPIDCNQCSPSMTGPTPHPFHSAAAPRDNEEWKMWAKHLSLSMIAITETCLMEGYQGLSEIVGYDTEICILFSEVSVMRGSIVPVYHHIALQGTTCQLYNLFLPHLQRFSLTRKGTTTTTCTQAGTSSGKLASDGRGFFNLKGFFGFKGYKDWGLRNQKVWNCPQSSICNHRSSILILRSSILNHRSSILNPQSSIIGPQSSIHGPQSSIHGPHSTVLNP